jgi:hypothetical protein
VQQAAGPLKVSNGVNDASSLLDSGVDYQLTLRRLVERALMKPDSAVSIDNVAQRNTQPCRSEAMLCEVQEFKVGIGR